MRLSLDLTPRQLRTRHPCGCVTRFDTVEWRSVAISRCDYHRDHERRHSAPEPTQGKQ